MPNIIQEPSYYTHTRINLQFEGTENIQYPVSNIRFILSTEISCIYKHKEKVRRLHLVILAPNIKAVEKLVEELESRGVNLHSDGRPIMGIHAKEILEILLKKLSW